jgi:hypothetical protein
MAGDLESSPGKGVVSVHRFSTNSETEGEQQNPIYPVESTGFAISSISGTAHMSSRKLPP